MLDWVPGMKKILVAFGAALLVSFAAAQDSLPGGGPVVRALEAARIQWTPADVCAAPLAALDLPEAVVQPLLATTPPEPAAIAPQPTVQISPALDSLREIAASRAERSPFELHPFGNGGPGPQIPRYNPKSTSVGLDEEQLGALRAVSELIAKNYAESVPSNKLLEGALHGMLSVLDPYSQFYTPEEAKKLYERPSVADAVPPPLVFSEVLEGRVGYLRLGQFVMDSVDDLLARVKKLRERGVLSLVIDLRGNPGGNIPAVRRMIAAFLKKDQVIMIEKYRAGGLKRHVAGEDGAFVGMPLKVLVDGDSASASEIFAGAIQDHRRGLIVGSDTYGKGIGQGFFPQDNGALIKLTLFTWLTPSGRSISKDESGRSGVHPDIVVEVPKEQAVKLAYKSAQQMSGGPFEDVFDPALQAALKP